MELPQSLKYTFVGLFSALVASGAIFLFTPEQKSISYVCTTTMEVYQFPGGISASGLTAYPYKENRTEGKRCNNGAWILVDKYMQDHNIIQPTINNSQSSQLQYTCYVDGKCIQK